jgi:hypothetical protein
MAATGSGKDVNAMLARLREKGVEATAETTMKTVADKLGITPREAYEMLVKD